MKKKNKSRTNSNLFKFLLALVILIALALRIYSLSNVPPSLYWDEASLGYNAYSILKTGRDEHGNFLPVTNFAAYGDYKPPLYIYAAVPSIAIFGLTEFAIRFPSAIFGVLTVFITYLLTKKLFQNQKIAILSALFLAISPWHLQFSRGAFEGNLGLFFSTLGIYSFLKFSEDKRIWLIPSALSFIAAMYTFTGQRLFVPFILLVLALQFRKQIQKNLKFVIPVAVFSSILFLPLFIFATQTKEGKLRFEEVTIFKNLDPVNTSVRYRSQDDDAWWSSLVHNRRFLYKNEYLLHYFDAFNPTFLFTRGDVNPRLSVQELGELYLIDLPFILIGIYYLISLKNKYRFLILGWLLVSPLGPAAARETPHALRMIHILPVFQILSAFGVYNALQKIKFKKIFIGAFSLALLISFLYYLHMYYFHWPQNYSSEWQYGYKQAVQKIGAKYNEADSIVVTTNLGRPYIYFLLYNKYDPQKFQSSSKINKDQFGFIDVLGFDKFIFTNDISKVLPPGKVLYLSAPGSSPQGAARIDSIYQLDGKPVFEISKKN